MRKVVIGSVIAAVSLCLWAAPGLGAATCPNANSDFVAYPINGSVGDPAPASGAEPLWDAIVAGAASEGLTIEQLAESLDLSVDGLYSLALEGWFGWDKNENRTVCVKPFPQQSHGQPDYFANFVDDAAHLKS